MTTQASKIASVFLLSSLMLGSACDQGTELPNPGSSLRDVTKITLKIKATGTLRGNGEWPDGVAPIPWPFPDFMADDFMNLSNQALAGGWASTEEAHAACYDACAENELEWAGTAFAEGEYDFGEVEFFEGVDGSLRYGVDAEYLVEFGCNCGFEEG